MNLRVRTVHALSAMATATLDRVTALGIDERQEAEQMKERKKERLKESARQSELHKKDARLHRTLNGQTLIFETLKKGTTVDLLYGPPPLHTC